MPRLNRPFRAMKQVEPRNSQLEDNIFRNDAKKVLFVIFEEIREHDFMFCLN